MADRAPTKQGRRRVDRLAPVEDARLPTLIIEPGQQPEHRSPYDVYLGQLSGETLRTMRGCLDRIARILAGVRLDDPPPADIERGTPVVTVTLPVTGEATPAAQ
ncbi:hypothetical protein BJ993_005097 [Nocardioides aromaticivorans]|uniref:Uncharacterized protein n=1 Tax=Nocardioides aromaticivorans TaxID=200618 RepID=A0A7Y9ZQK4_9ACTN|nr:hypothetical protein [Nocardioides aromaticivorans]NYI47951.1 hypothetical protein [Nocardioides aromaticivorans]